MTWKAKYEPYRKFWYVNDLEKGKSFRGLALNDMGKKDAHLIAAAPKMLKTLRECRNTLIRFGNTMKHTDHKLLTCMMHVDQAIEKAQNMNPEIKVTP